MSDQAPAGEAKTYLPTYDGCYQEGDRVVFKEPEPEPKPES